MERKKSIETTKLKLTLGCVATVFTGLPDVLSQHETKTDTAERRHTKKARERGRGGGGGRERRKKERKQDP